MVCRILRWAFISLGPEQKNGIPPNVVIVCSISMFSLVAPKSAARRTGLRIFAPLSMAPVIHTCMHHEHTCGQPPFAARAIRRLSRRPAGLWRHWLHPRRHGAALDPGGHGCTANDWVQATRQRRDDPHHNHCHHYHHHHRHWRPSRRSTWLASHEHANHEWLDRPNVRLSTVTSQ